MLYSYNVTVKIDKSISTEWLTWMKEIHIPEVLATGMFTHHKFCKLLEPIDEEGETYVVQYYTDSKGKYNNYIELHAPILRERGFAKFGNKFIAFRSLLEVME